MRKCPFIVKDVDNKYLVIYAEETKSKQFSSYKEALLVKNGIC